MTRQTHFFLCLQRTNSDFFIGWLSHDHDKAAPTVLIYRTHEVIVGMRLSFAWSCRGDFRPCARSSTVAEVNSKLHDNNVWHPLDVYLMYNIQYAPPEPGLVKTRRAPFRRFRGARSMVIRLCMACKIMNTPHTHTHPVCGRNSGCSTFFYNSSMIMLATSHKDSMYCSN